MKIRNDAFGSLDSQLSLWSGLLKRHTLFKVFSRCTLHESVEISRLVFTLDRFVNGMIILDSVVFSVLVWPSEFPLTTVVQKAIQDSKRPCP